MIETILSSIPTIFIIALGISILIFVHEFGHFITAKWAKVKVEAFSLGFGPKIISFKRGDTEYRLSLIPLGGYVKMAGESLVSEDNTGAPDEFISKPPFTRIGIFIAGVTMNFLFAFPACILMYLIGVNFAAPQVGSIESGKTEWNSDMQVGDEIISVNDQDVDSIQDYRRIMIRLPKGSKARVVLKRKGDNIVTEVIAKGSHGFGVLPLTNIVRFVDKDSPAEKGGLKPGDEILEIDKIPIYSNNQIESLINLKKSDIVSIKVLRKNNSHNEVHNLSVTPREYSFYSAGLDGVNPPVIDSVKKGSAADLAGIKPGDKVVAINGKDVLSWNAFTKIIKNNADVNLMLEVLRNNKRKEFVVVPQLGPTGFGQIGVTLLPSNIIGDVVNGSPIEIAGLEPNDIILKINDQSINDITDFQRVVLSWQKDNAPLKTTIKRGKNTIDFNVEPQMERRWDLGISLKPKSVLQKYGFGRAVVEGVRETFDLLVLTFQLIGKLITGEESATGLAGPIGIFKFSYIIVKYEGISYFLWLLALFSLSLAILNLLPIPILDGGGILFTLIEKIKGSPVNVKIQIIAQYIGLFLILSLLFFATYNDLFVR